jgi:molybdopterin molybdotransferase
VDDSSSGVQGRDLRGWPKLGWLGKAPRVITLEEARRIISEHITALPPESVDLAQALGRILREDAEADDFYPSTDRSMMDGYAVKAGDKSERFRVVAEVVPGMDPGLTLAGGECARIYTGAILPGGSSQVIIQEETRREGEWMVPLRRSETAFVRRRGQEARAGDVVLREGTRLGAAELAILAQIGATRPKVSPVPRVTHLASGGELVAPAAKPAPGQIRDTNSALIDALTHECGAIVQAHARVGDDLPVIVKSIAEQPSDLLLISGGASVGDHDFGARALQESGFTIHFNSVNLRPGKPLTFGTRSIDGRLAFVLPGNPVSHFVCFHVAVQLAIELLRAESPRWSFLNARLAEGEPIRANPRETFWPARARAASDGEVFVTPLQWTSSGDTFALAGANALIRVNAPLAAGETAPTLLLGTV